MIDRTAFLADAQKLVTRLEKDLRARCDDMPEVGSAVEAEYRKAKEAGRTGQALEVWRADAVTQQAIAWVLSCVFVRFLEDNRLIDPPRISGPVPEEVEKKENRLARARDEHELFFQRHPGSEFTDREYLLAIFDDLAGRPGTRDLFGPHNPIRAIPNWLSPDAAKDDILPFFQRIEAGSGRLVHDFTDESLNTRFLGDLYQDLSKAARKKYALLQTPVFVEEFILDRTLTPAVQTFGLERVKLIDPACGSGHFLLGAFARLLDAWARREPATPRRELVRRALDAVHGVDLNPYAVAVARFRLLVATWRECGVTGLTNAPEFHLNLACGDSLLHGSTKAVQGDLPFAMIGHHYHPEDANELERLLQPGRYHVVVANPPYITPKDKGLNRKYREHYSACHGKYSLAVPFMERIFNLACEDGYTGQITANSFMRREFGKKLITRFFPKIDLTYVIDTSGAFIPGHGTPTVILFGRNRRPGVDTIRTAMGIRGEPITPDDPAQGRVWTAILGQLDQPGSHSAYLSVADSPRANFHKHPWSIGGGGAAELKEELDERAESPLADVASEIGVLGMTNADEVMLAPASTFRRRGVEPQIVRPMTLGNEVRDWVLDEGSSVTFPYANEDLIQVSTLAGLHRWLWPARTTLGNRATFNKLTYFEEGRPWWEWHQLTLHRLRTPLSLVFGEIASHNHFVLDRGGRVFNHTAPVVKLAATATESDYLALLGFLNSSTVCFYLKQICHQKQMTGGDGVRVESRAKVPYAMSGTSVGRVPVPKAWKQGPLRDRLIAATRELDTLSQSISSLTASRAVEKALAEKIGIEDVWSDFLSERQRIRSRLIVLQEEIDFTVYGMFGLAAESLLCDPATLPLVSLDAGARPFDIFCGTNEDGFTVPPDIPAEWPDSLRTLWRKRMDAIKDTPDLRVIEDPHYKRRWIGRQGVFNQTKRSDELLSACKEWLLDHLESYFDLDGRMNDEGRPTAQVEASLISTAKLADIAGRDSSFQAVAELYRGRLDFDVTKLVTELVAAESVPLLPVLRYKPSGLDKRRAWERTWELQRQEDAIDARATKQGLGVNEGGWTPATDDGVSPLTPGQAELLKQERVGKIDPPPKYKSGDFQKSDYWRLRGGLDVPKERWVSFPHCEGADGLPLIAWAGYDHLQLAKAIAAHYVHIQEQEGGRDDPRLVPLLAGLVELLPWLKQWHNDIDPEFSMGMGDYFEGFVQDEARQMGRTIEQVRAWQPPARPARGRGRRTTKQEG
jgi:hypothetical protein